jgi:inner membrane protein
MRTPTHAAFGLLVSTTALSFWSVPVHLDPGALAGAVAGSLLPDLDAPRSLPGRLWPRLSRRLEARFAHRGATHSLAALGAVAIAALPVGLWRGAWLASLLLGCASHLLADCMTKAGAPLFYPRPHACVLPGPERFRFACGAAGEKLFGAAVVLLLVPALCLSQAGGVWHALRQWAATPAMAYRDYREATTETVLAFQGQWQQTRVPVTGEALILEAEPSPTRFVIALDGQVWLYGEQGDILPQRSRIRITGRPVTVDTLRLHETPYDQLLARLPAASWASGRVGTDVPYRIDARCELPRTRHPVVRCEEQALTLAHAPRDLVARLRPRRAVDRSALSQLEAQVRQAHTELVLLQVTRPPVHCLRLQEALERLQGRQLELAALQDATVRFTGVLYLRRRSTEEVQP